MQSVLEKLRDIARLEGIVVDEAVSFNHVFSLLIHSTSIKALGLLVDASEGDLRKSIMYLQSAHRLCAADGVLTTSIVNEISGVSSIINKNSYAITRGL
jgi:DNA polymerase III delta prime subunit